MAEADEKEAKADAETAAPEAPEPKKPKSALVGMLVNGAGIFVLTLAAVVAGGFVNAILHPSAPQEYVLELDKEGRIKDGRIKPYVPPQPKKKAEPKKEKKEEKKAEKKPSGPALFYSLEPALVVNFEEGANVRFLQVGIDIMTREEHTPEILKQHDPMIRNNLLLLISNRDYKQLMTREGKDQLRKEALVEVKKILKKETGEANVEDLLFTSFVVQ